MAENRYELNKQLAQMLKGGVIMDVTTPEQAKVAEAAGACAVMALERIPADIRAAGGVSRMSDPKMIRGIQEAVSIPVMAKCRIGHFVEAQILEAIEIDYIDESEVLSPADDVYHIDKTQFKVPFVCGARDLGEALRRIEEGASMIRTKGEPGTGDVVQAVRHMRAMNSEIRRVQNLREDELYEAAKQLKVPVHLLRYVHDNGRLPVVNFAAGGVATPADAALMMQLGAEGVFVGSGIFKSASDVYKRQEAFEIRQLPDLERPMDGLILPGGESTAMRKLLDELGLYEPLRAKIAAGLPVYGTCAGLLLLAKEIEGGTPCFATMDVSAVRNAYGRQLGSFYTEAEFAGLGTIPMTFIRAPYIASLQENVKVLATVDEKIVAARQGNQFATAFHPELNEDVTVHRYFLEEVCKGN